MGTPYEVQLDQKMGDAIEVTLAPGAPEANRKYLLNIGVNKQGRSPRTLREKKQIWFRKGGADLQKGEEGEAREPCSWNSQDPPRSGHVQVPPIQRKVLRLE